MMVAFIDEQRAVYGVGPICEVLPIAPSTYYAQKAIQALARATPTKGAPIRMAREILSIPQRHVSAHQVEVAREYLEARRTGHWSKSLPRELYGYEYHFHHKSAAVDEWLAREVLGMWEWQRRTGTRELVEAVEMQTMALGDVAFVGLPGELLSEFGHQIREQSPFPHNFIVELANGWHGYIPTEEAFQHGGYETCLAMQSRLVPEAGRMMTDAALRLLSGLAQADGDQG